MAQRSARLTVVLVLVIALAVAGVVALFQIGKWTCDPPDQVWVEGPDHCVDLP
jgi:cell division septal protein FtsQ